MKVNVIVNWYLIDCSLKNNELKSVSVCYDVCFEE